MIPRLELRELAIAGGVAAGAALLMGIVLATASTPRDFKAELAQLQTEAKAVQGLARHAKASGPYPVDAVCAEPASAAARMLLEAVRQDAADLQLTAARLDVAPGAAGRVLQPVNLRFEVSGSYEGVSQMLQRLARIRPLVFAETVDMIPKTSSVTLSFAGRAYCGA